MRLAFLLISALGLTLSACSSSSGGGGGGGRPSKTYIIMPNGQVSGCKNADGTNCS